MDLSNKIKKRFIALAVSQVITLPSYSAILTVDSALDDNGFGCTLREAVVSINTALLQDGCLNSGGDFSTADTINFNLTSLSPRIISLNDAQGGALTVTNNSNMTINGTVNSNLTITSDGNDRILYVEDGSVEMNNLTISGGSAVLGGGIYVNNSSSLSLTNVTISDNDGGGIFVRDSSSVSLLNSTVLSNLGAGIISRGLDSYRAPGFPPPNYTTLTLTNSVVSDNLSTGISSSYASVSLTNSVISGNSGFGVSAEDESTVEITSSTISDNSSNGIRATGAGYQTSGPLGGTFSSVEMINSTLSGNGSSGASVFYGAIDITNSTISNNFGIGVVALRGGLISLSNSIVSGNLSPSSREILALYLGTVSGNSSNILGDYSGLSSEMFVYDSPFAPPIPTLPGPSDLNAAYDGNFASPLSLILNPLADNGCEQLAGASSSAVCVKTHALAPNSIALNFADELVCGVGTTINVDQRGVPRNDERCDIGSFEGAVEPFTDNSEDVDSMYYTSPLKNGKTLTIPL